MENQNKTYTRTFDNLAPKLAWRQLSLCSSREARALLDYAIADRLRALPLGLLKGRKSEVLSVACGAKNEREVQTALKFSIGCTIRTVVVPEEGLRQAIFTAYKGDSSELEEELSKLVAQPADLTAATKATNAANQDDQLISAKGDAAKLLKALLNYALARGASDIHLIPSRSGTLVEVRIDGLMHKRESPVCGLDLHLQLVNRLKVLSRLDTTIKNQPQDGSFQSIAAGESINIRISFMPTLGGEKVVLRLMGNEALPDLSSLGFSDSTLKLIEHTIQIGRGLVLIAGPTGSGKSTTLYSCLNRLKDKNLSLVSIEDPVEMKLPFVAQSQVNEKQGLDYARSLRAALRQDPDVIMLGEIRDQESAELSMQAAFTGHLVLSTVHAGDALEVIARLEGLGLRRDTIVHSIALIVYQRLIPKLCPECKVCDAELSLELSVELSRKLARQNFAGDFEDHAEYTKIYRSNGCQHCEGTGISGRVLVEETLELSEAAKSTLLETRDLIAARKKLANSYLLELRTSLISRLKEGLIGAEVSAQSLA